MPPFQWKHRITVRKICESITRQDALETGTIVNADEASHWDVLNAFFPTERINHSEAYSLDGIHTNGVESYFSRLRRMVGGQHHHVSPKYLNAYAAHAAWLEDHRRESNGSLANRIARNMMAAPVRAPGEKVGTGFSHPDREGGQIIICAPSRAEQRI